MDGWNTYAKTEDKQKIVIYYCYCYCRMHRIVGLALQKVISLQN